ncbi:hypothetical protein A2U01_0089863 [Trifolium medium]|uniref:Uncharacterized protein n=1 Tax=Trifolium medium TaxID=97028 RepID=A0A392U5G4_9FABA|nr:hypothetical protein [Trifolium medium]
MPPIQRLFNVTSLTHLVSVYSSMQNIVSFCVGTIPPS